MKTHLLCFLFIFSVFTSYSQMDENFDLNMQNFEKDKQDGLKKIKENLSEADKIYSESLSESNFSKMQKASDLFKENYHELFLIYEAKIDVLTKETEENKKKYIIYLTQEAKNKFRNSISERLSANKEKEENICMEFLKSAHVSEQEAIKLQDKAFGVLNGRIAAETNIPDHNYRIDLTEQPTNSIEYNTRSFSVHNASLPENFTFNSNENGVNKTNGNQSDGQINNINTNNSVNNPNTIVKGSEYRIQIGTSILPASDSQIKRLNPTDLGVNIYKSQVYYKYTIGSFSNYQEAKNFKNANGLSNTYITEYKNGKEVKLYMKDI